MLKRSWKLISHLERIGDFFIIILAFFTAYYARPYFAYLDTKFHLHLNFAGRILAPLSDYALVLLVALICQTIILTMLGAYNSMRLRSLFQLVWMSFLSSSCVFFSLSTALYLLKLDLSRGFVASFCLLLFLLLVVERCCVLSLLRFFRRRGYNYRNIVVCGVGDQALVFADKILRRSELGLNIRAFVDLRSPSEENMHDVVNFKQKLEMIGQTANGIRIIYGIEEAENFLTESPIDEVIFTDMLHVMPEVRDIMQVCADQGIRTTMVANFFSIGLVKSGISYFDGVPLVHFVTPPGDMWELAVKRFFDIVVSLFALILLMPFLLLVGLLVKLTSPGPILYVQKRVGLNGHLFNLYKFRSMYVGADKKLEELKKQNEMMGPAFKMKNDPRVTAIGKWIRRFSIDELPQLWNVFKGDMSLVGPRPPVPDEVKAYERRYRRRLSMRPGMTCTWQVSGRNDITDFSKWVQLDLEYIDNWSLLGDVALLLKTVPAVIFARGAS